jgi:hypothetical protein
MTTFLFLVRRLPCRSAQPGSLLRPRPSFVRYCRPKSSLAVESVPQRARGPAPGPPVRHASGATTPPATWIDRLPASIRPYLYLTRIDKPIGTLLLFYPCGMFLHVLQLATHSCTIQAWSITMASYAIEAPLTMPLTNIALFGLGAIVMRGAGCTINDMWDKNLDKAVGEPANVCAMGATVFIKGREDTNETARARRYNAPPGIGLPRRAADCWAWRLTAAELVQVQCLLLQREVSIRQAY